jgi:hypothetical protein
VKGSPAAGYGDALEAQAMELMSAAKRGDPAAFEALSRELRGRAFSVARALVGSSEDALELTQEAFLKTFAARATYRDGERFASSDISRGAAEILVYGTAVKLGPA